MKPLLKWIMAQTPYRIVRDKGANRFQAIDTCLRLMKERGFAPKTVIDGGAHLGWFSLMAQKIFPDAAFHLVDPQPACREALETLCAEKKFGFHPYALDAKPGQVGLYDAVGVPSTGAHVSSVDGAVPVPAETLDNLFGSITPEDRALIKLDLQGYELNALRGGTALLRSAEAILTEVTFYAQAYEPSIAELVSFLREHDYRLYDIAALGGRTRDNRLHSGDFVFVREGTQLLEDGSWA